jgi:hypothetical protein
MIFTRSGNVPAAEPSLNGDGVSTVIELGHGTVMGDITSVYKRHFLSRAV